MTGGTMGGLAITFRQAADAGACIASVRGMASHLGGIIPYGRDTPIPLVTVLDVRGLDDALWALFVVDETRWRHLALDYATRVLPVFESAMPGDSRVRDAIAFYREYTRRPATRAADAAWAARAAGAADAADAAEVAWAAGAAETTGAAWAARAAETTGAARTARAAETAWAAGAAWAAWAAWAARDERDWQEDRYRKYVTGKRRPQPLPLPLPRKETALKTEAER